MTTGETPARTCWPSKAEFYAERGGTFSGESDYGHFNWDDEVVRPGAFAPGSWMYRRLMVSHVHDTGDWYAVDSSGAGEAVLLGTVAGDIPEPEVYAFFSDWARNHEPGRPLTWFRERTAAFNRQVAEARARKKVNP